MTEQQVHLQSLLQQQASLLEQVQTLNSNASATRDLLLKVQGAIEYLQQVGVTLPEPEVAEATEEATEEVVEEAAAEESAE